jgi:hypothetical protein
MLKNYVRIIQLIIFSLLIGSSMSAFPQAMLTKLGASFPMFNGNDLSAWVQTGNASWQISGKEIIVNQGSGMLVSRLSIPDYIIEFDYWVSSNAQVTAYIRCTNPNVINVETAYEVPLINQASGVGAGSILMLSKAKVAQVANQWNHMQISAIDRQISVTLNGVANQVVDTRFNAGSFAMSYQGGEFRLKNVNLTIPGRW